jgi:hypothetical protein
LNTLIKHLDSIFQYACYEHAELLHSKVESEIYKK